MRSRKSCPISHRAYSLKPRRLVNARVSGCYVRTYNPLIHIIRYSDTLRVYLRFETTRTKTRNRCTMQQIRPYSEIWKNEEGNLDYHGIYNFYKYPSTSYEASTICVRCVSGGLRITSTRARLCLCTCTRFIRVSTYITHTIYEYDRIIRAMHRSCVNDRRN